MSIIRRNLIANTKDNVDYPDWFKKHVVCWYDVKRQRATNESMKLNPVLKDFSGNGLDMQLKNFAWEGMSGMNGYGAPIMERWIKNGKVGTYIAKGNIVHLTNIAVSNFVILYVPVTEWFNNKSKYLIKGLNGKALYFSVDKKETIALKVTKDGIYTVDWTICGNKQNKGFVMDDVGDCDITIEQLPLYENALVFDGVDDYGISENQPILDDYEVIAKRKWLNNKNTGSLAGKRINVNIEDGAFQFERSQIFSINFGAINRLFNKDIDISYQNSKEYNGIKIERGKLSDSNILIIGKYGTPNLDTSNIALYKFILFDRTLTPEEREYVKNNIMTDPVEPIAIWSARGRSNDEPEATRNILPDLTGNGHHITLHNFAFSKKSGYGGYGDDFSTYLKWTSNSTFTYSGNIIHITKMINANTAFFAKVGTIGNNGLKVQISGIRSNQLVRYVYNDKNGISVRYNLTENKEYILPKSYNTSDKAYTGFSSAQFVGDCDITIELLPEYPDALVFDGTDDYGVCENMPIFTKEKGYTIIAKRKDVTQKQSSSIFALSPNGSANIKQIIFEGFSDRPYCRSFSDFHYISFFPNDISYQTTYRYNNKIITASEEATVNGELSFGNNTKCAFYEAHIFDHDLTPTEIEDYIKRNIDATYQLPKPE